MYMSYGARHVAINIVLRISLGQFVSSRFNSNLNAASTFSIIIIKDSIGCFIFYNSEIHEIKRGQ